LPLTHRTKCLCLVFTHNNASPYSYFFCLVNSRITFSNSFGFTRSKGFQSFKVICDISSSFFINCLLRDNDFFGGESVFISALSPSGIPKCGRFLCLFNERPCAAYWTFHSSPELNINIATATVTTTTPPRHISNTIHAIVSSIFIS
jgi:hypothetical protein